MSDPKYLLRLDLVNNAASDLHSRGDRNRSYHLQADHANMKLLELELQRAVDEANSVHAQRINRYLS